MSDDEILKGYFPLVEFLGEVFGKDCEITLHDVRNLENSLILIKNNISGRKIGAPLTDLTLKVLSDSQYTDKNYITKYISKTKNGNKFCSSTYFIKNKDGKIIGFLCININTGKFDKIKSDLNNFFDGLYGRQYLNNNNDNNKTTENLNSTIDELVMSIIKNTLSEMDIPPERMSVEEKMNIVSKLNCKGVFLLKGAIAKVANELKTSENTIYRYINK